ncbi:polyphenol oxidase family protein [Oerskovia paurometabola]|uniref:polyphenol oxidase family protein n=1 Tax=Oerskovia paurometabola TaxID=162170 RepID=UPI003801603D
MLDPALPAPPVLEVDLGPGVRAAFTGRAGGTSPAPWSGLNLGLGVGDDAQRVLGHRAAVGRLLGAPLVFGTQVHGAGVRVLTADDRAARVERDAGAATCGEHDALVTAQPGLGLGVLVADCVPVLLADPEARVVGVAHAGRQGLLAGVVGTALDALLAQGARAGRVRAVVGPAACGRCYEVPEEMRDEVAALRPGTGSTTSRGTPALDLPAGVVAELRAAGVAEIVETGICTLEDERFYSHRLATRRGATTGRFAGVVALG